MQLNQIDSLLYRNQYPGRGIIIGTSENGKQTVIIYFIMGRSENSRNRIIESTADGIRTSAFDPSKLVDPSLVIYNPIRQFDGQTIVTNGVQTDTIKTYLSEGRSFEDALAIWTFEPDPPILTPRISGLIDQSGRYKLSIIKSLDGNPQCCCRFYYNYTEPVSGIGHFISTYKNDGNPPPSFEGEPLAIEINLSKGLNAFAEKIWNALNPENRVSLYACEINNETGESSDLLINKHK